MLSRSARSRLSCLEFLSHDARTFTHFDGIGCQRRRLHVSRRLLVPASADTTTGSNSRTRAASASSDIQSLGQASRRSRQPVRATTPRSKPKRNDSDDATAGVTTPVHVKSTSSRPLSRKEMDDIFKDIKHGRLERAEQYMANLPADQQAHFRKAFLTSPYDIDSLFPPEDAKRTGFDAHKYLAPLKLTEEDADVLNEDRIDDLTVGAAAGLSPGMLSYLTREYISRMPTRTVEPNDYELADLLLSGASELPLRARRSTSSSPSAYASNNSQSANEAQQNHHPHPTSSTVEHTIRQHASRAAAPPTASLHSQSLPASSSALPPAHIHALATRLLSSSPTSDPSSLITFRSTTERDATLALAKQLVRRGAEHRLSKNKHKRDLSIEEAEKEVQRQVQSVRWEPLEKGLGEELVGKMVGGRYDEGRVWSSSASAGVDAAEPVAAAAKKRGRPAKSAAGKAEDAGTAAAATAKSAGGDERVEKVVRMLAGNGGYRDGESDRVRAKLEEMLRRGS